MSFAFSEHTADVDAVGTLKLLEVIRCLRLGNRTRYYQAAGLCP